MNITPRELADRLNLKTTSTVNTYLCRAGFSHIKRERNEKREVILTNVSLMDIMKLSLFVKRNRKDVPKEEKEFLTRKIKELEARKERQNNVKKYLQNNK